jgi:hypothetical protein
VGNNQFWILEFAYLPAPEAQLMAGRDFGFSGLPPRSVILKKIGQP